MELNQTNFESNFALYAKPIYRYFYFRTSSEETAKDLTAILFTNFWKKLKGGLEVKNTKALIYTMAHGLVVDYYRKQKSQISISLELVNPFKLGRQDNIEKELEVEDDNSTLRKHLELIKDEYRDILVLYYIEEMKISEIAKMQDKKESTIRVTIHRAIAALRKIYEKN